MREYARLQQIGNDQPIGSASPFWAFCQQALLQELRDRGVLTDAELQWAWEILRRKATAALEVQC